MEVTAVLVGGAELASNAKLRVGAQRAGWRQHRQWCTQRACECSMGGAEWVERPNIRRSV